MEKIKFIADTASDIPDEDLKEYNIDMPSVPITVDGEGYYERKSFSIQEFYEVLEKSSEIPATSRVPADDYLACYQKAWEEGYTDIINVTINAGGSGTNASAHMAKDRFFKKNPEAQDKLNIYVVDSRTYCLGYGYPVILAAQMARDGKSAKEVLDFLEDWFSRLEIYLACYTLEYAKKSGRISAAAAFVGDMLGLRPIISLIDGETKTVEKVRGEKNIIGRLIDIYKRQCRDHSGTVAVCASVEEYGRELQAALKEESGVEAPLYLAGASITINAGPRIAAVCCLGEKRPVPCRED